MDKTTARLLERATEAVNDLCDWPFPEESAVDVVGTIQDLITKLDVADKRRTAYPGLKQRLMQEMDANAEGDRYYVKTGDRTADRSFNTSGLLGVFAEAMGKEAAEWNIPKTISALLGGNAVEFKWRWTELQKLADVFDVSLVIAKHEIADGDPEALIGEVWKSATKVVAKDQGPEVRV